MYQLGQVSEARLTLLANKLGISKEDAIVYAITIMDYLLKYEDMGYALRSCMGTFGPSWTHEPIREWIHSE